MRLLAHYTVFNSEIWHLHIFDVGKEGAVAHFPIAEETANTYFVEGILVIGNADFFCKLNQSKPIIAKALGTSLHDAAAAIARMQTDEFQGTDIFKVSIPTLLIEQI